MLCGFKWILEGKLAGSGLPGLLAPFEEDMEFLASSGFTLLVTLTEDPLPVPAEDYGIEGIHFPIPDMGFPIPRDCEPICRRVVEAMADGAALLHCRAGLGRTGMLVACCLVTLGSTPEDALSSIRKINPNYVQTTSQEHFISNYAKYLSELNVNQ